MIDDAVEIEASGKRLGVLVVRKIQRQAKLIIRDTSDRFSSNSKHVGKYANGMTTLVLPCGHFY